MASLRDRVKALETRAQTNATALLDAEAVKRLGRWPDLILERYTEGRLDDLAATLPSLQSLLASLEQEGSVIRFQDHWHPLYGTEDRDLFERVVSRLDAQGDALAAAIESLLFPAETAP